MLLILYEDICQALPEQMLRLIPGWYTEDSMWNIFFNKLQYLI